MHLRGIKRCNSTITLLYSTARILLTNRMLSNLETYGCGQKCRGETCKRTCVKPAPHGETSGYVRCLTT